MRILKVTQAYYPFLDKGGPAVKVPSIAGRLAQRGHTLTVLTADFGLAKTLLSDAQRPRTEPEAAEPPGSGSSQPAGGRRRREERLLQVEGVEVVYLSTLVRYRALTLNPGVLAFCRQRLNDFQIVHIYGLYDLLGPAVASFCCRAGIPYLVEPMGMFLPIVRSLRLKRLYHRLFGARLLRGASLLVATSGEEAGELAAGGMPEDRIVVRRNGIEIPAELPAPGDFHRQWRIPPATRLVLFLGRLVAKKSPDLLLRAFARCRASRAPEPVTLLVLAGPEETGGYRRQLERLAAELGLRERVLFTGPLFEERKWAAYRDADLFVLPSQSENFGNTVAEAVVCGTPVIVTDRCGIATLVDGRAGLVVPHDLGALQASLNRLLEDGALRARLRAGCAPLAAEFSWDGPIAQMEKIYLEVLAKHRIAGA